MQQVFGKNFEKIARPVGTIIEVDDFAEARTPADRLKSHFGDLGIKRSNAQIKDPCSRDYLAGKPIPGGVNFPPKQVANLFSEVLPTGFYLPPGGVVMVHPERKVSNGAKLG